jgi:hypothetical protein
MRAAGTHPFLRFPADALERRAQARLALHGREGAVDSAGGATHVLAHRQKLGGGEHRAFELEEVALARILIEHVAEIAEAGAQCHDPGFAQGIDRRIGDLAECLAEIMVQSAIMLGEHGDRRIVTHAPDRLVPFLHHRVEDHLQLLEREAGAELAAAQLLAFVHHGLGRIGLDDVVDHADAARPLAEGLAGGEELADFGIAVETRPIKIDTDRLAGADTAFGQDRRFVELHHAGLGADDEK